MVSIRQISKNIMEIRRKKGLNQQELANLLGKSLRTIQNYESGVIDFPISTLTNLASCLDCTLEELLSPGVPITLEDISERYPAPPPIGSSLKHLDDFFSILFELNNKENVEYTLDFFENPETDEHGCSIRFTSLINTPVTPQAEPEINAEASIINHLICGVLKQFDEIRKKFAHGEISWNEYEYWCTSTMAYYPMVTFKNKVYNEEPSEELIRMRKTLDELRHSCLIFEYSDELQSKRQIREEVHREKLKKRVTMIKKNPSDTHTKK